MKTHTAFEWQRLNLEDETSPMALRLQADDLMTYCLKLNRFATSFDGLVYIARVMKPLAKAAQMRICIIGDFTEFQQTVRLHPTNAALGLSGNTKLLHTRYCKLDVGGRGESMIVEGMEPGRSGRWLGCFLSEPQDMLHLGTESSCTPPSPESIVAGP